MWKLALVAIAPMAGCRVAAPFACERDEQCRSGDSGRCEETGFCSFADDGCPSGRRYHDGAGQYAGVCTAVMVDAAPIDTGFDLSTCPAGYTVTLPSTAATSRYRVIPTQATFWVQEVICNAGLPGATHLATLRTLQELTDAVTVLGGGTGPATFIGAIQDPAAATPAAGWIHLDGTPVSSVLWSPTEPDDDGDGEANHNDQIGAIERATDRLSDADGSTAHGALCECDGVPIAPIARTFIDNDPNNPN